MGMSVGMSMILVGKMQAIIIILTVTTCGIGEEIKVNATLSSDATCRTCPAGTYQDTPNLNQSHRNRMQSKSQQLIEQTPT